VKVGLPYSESNKFSTVGFFLLTFALSLFPFDLFSQPGTWVAVYGGTQYDRGKGIAQTTDNGYIVCGSTSSYGSGTTDFYLLKIDSAGKFQWENTFGGPNIENAFSVQQTSDSGFVLSGYSNSFGSGNYDAFLVKTNSLGVLQWERSFGSSDWDFIYWAEQTADGGYILAGESYSFGNSTQAWLVKTDANGDTLWTRTFGTQGADVFKEVHQTADKGFLAGGTTTTDAGDQDFFLVRTDSAGTKKWERSFGGTGNDICNSVAVCADGGFLMGGYATISGVNKISYTKTNSAGDPLLTKVDTFDAGSKSISRIRETFDGMIITLINSNVGGFGGQEIFLDKWNGPWNQWVRTFGGTYDEEGYDLVQTADSGFALVGYTETFGKGPDNIFIVKTASDGHYNPVNNIYVGTGDLEEEDQNILLYPNPCSGSLSLQFNDGFLNDKHQLLFTVSDISGRIIFSSETNVPLYSVDPFRIEIPSDRYSSGLFTAAFQSGSNIVHRKLVLVK
jgi:hypothetical protein